MHKPCSLALNLAVTTSLIVRGICVPGTGELLLWGPQDSRVEAGVLHSWRSLLQGQVFGSCFPRAAASCTEQGPLLGSSEHVHVCNEAIWVPAGAVGPWRGPAPSLGGPPPALPPRHTG